MNEADRIITALKTELEQKLNVTRGYETEPTIKYGLYAYDQVELSPPTLCFAEEGLELEEIFGDGGTAWLPIVLYGYAKHDGLGNNESVRALALDTLRFLLVDFSYEPDIMITDAIKISPGGEGMPAALFTLGIRVKFDFTNTTINS